MIVLRVHISSLAEAEQLSVVSDGPSATHCISTLFECKGENVTVELAKHIGMKVDFSK